MAPALWGPTRRSPPESTQAIDPPPAPTLRTSTEEMPTMCPVHCGPSHVSLVNFNRPSRSRLTSNVVPPASHTMTSDPRPSTLAYVAPAIGAIAGPDLTV